MAQTVVFDGACSFCRAFKRFIEALDWLNVFVWVDLSKADYDELPVSEEACRAALQVVADGDVFEGFYAVRRISRSVPLLFPAFLLLHLPGVPWIGEKTYAWVADHRHCATERHP